MLGARLLVSFAATLPLVFLSAALAHESTTLARVFFFFLCPAFAAGVPADVHFVPSERRPLRRCGRGGFAMTSTSTMIHETTQSNTQRKLGARGANAARFAWRLACLW